MRKPSDQPQAPDEDTVMNKDKPNHITHDWLGQDSKEIETLSQPVESSPQAEQQVTVTKEIKRDPYRLVGATVANKYRLEEYAGGGGMGAVYRCYQTDSAQVFALKILKPDIVVNNPIYAELFEREVEAARQLNDPHIVRLIDNGFDDNFSYMVMEWLDGHTLEAVLQGGRLNIDRVAHIFGQICGAFATAHDKNIIHLDIKPANIFIVESEQTKDYVKVIDFGLARVLRSDSGTTVTRFLGTYQYCSPEHFGGKLTLRSDIYSLGVILYQLLTGVLPFRTSHINAKMHPNLEMPPISPLLKIRPDLPRALESVILKALSRHPDGRQASVQQLYQEFLAAINTQPEAKLKKESLQDPSKWYWKVAGVLAMIATIGIVPATIGGVILANWSQPAIMTETLSMASSESLPDKRVLPPSRRATSHEDGAIGNWRLLYTLRGHDMLVWSVAFSPDGSTVASASQDNTIKLWDVTTGSLKRTFPVYYKGEHYNTDHVVTFSPDGSLLASGNVDRVLIWDVKRVALRAMLTGLDGNVYSIAFSPDGHLLASSDDSTVKLWDVEDEKLIRNIPVSQNGPIESVIFSPDGKMLATGDYENNVKLWEVATGELLKTMSGHKDVVWTVAFSPDGQTVASASLDRTVRLWDVKTGELKRTLLGHNDTVWSVIYSPLGKRLATGSFDRTIKLWNPVTEELVQTLEGHEDSIHGIAFSPNGRLLASASNDHTVRVWSVQ